jgi:hypothetical protein
MSWNQKQEEIILDILIEGVEHQGVLIEKTTTGKNKRHFEAKTERGIISKARSLTNEALLNDILVTMPEPAPKPKKKTAAERRAELFARKTKMTPQEKGRKSVQDAITAARLAVAKREKAAQKARETRSAKK